jgi:hypothetical protein
MEAPATSSWTVYTQMLYREDITDTINLLLHKIIGLFLGCFSCQNPCEASLATVVLPGTASPPRQAVCYFQALPHPALFGPVELCDLGLKPPFQACNTSLHLSIAYVSCYRGRDYWLNSENSCMVQGDYYYSGMWCPCIDFLFVVLWYYQYWDYSTELESIWKEVVVVKLRYYPGICLENRENLQQDSISQSRFKLSTSWIWV